MKKLFSIALVIAMAISCLAIGSSAATENVWSADSDLRFEAEFVNDNTQLKFSVIVDLTMEEFGEWSVDTGAMDVAFIIDLTQLKAHDPEKVEATFTGADDYLDSLGCDGDGLTLDAVYFDTAITALPYRNQCTITYYFDVIAAPGETITIVDDGTCVSYDSTFYVTTPEISVVVPEKAPTYEAPASAMAQELAGCEACGVEAGVRFIAEVDAAADEYGMYITANGKTFTLTSASADFIRKVETEETVTFTAVIFSDLTFEVVVFEKYGDTEVKSDAVRN